MEDRIRHIFGRLAPGLLAGLLVLGTPPAASAAAPAAAPAADVADSTTGSPVVPIRAAYQAAWTLRAAGEYGQAVERAGEGLSLVDAAIAGNPDATTRLELVDLRARLAGVRDGAANDLQSLPRVEPGNEADDKVLAAAATEDIELQTNAEVLRWIQFFTGSGRSTFERWLKRSGRYMELFRGVLKQEGLPPDLVHLVFVESGFNLHARSVSAAVGPWQFLKSSGRLFGLNVNQWVDERKDPEKSTVAAARYLKHLYGIFGDWPLALASYNAGEGTVLRAIKNQGTTNYWDLRLPQQTEEYVPKFMAVLAISRDPERYGFDAVEMDEPMQFDEVAFKGPVDLRALAKLAECSYDELRILNPAFSGAAARGPEGVTVIRVPDGKGSLLVEKLQSGNALPAVNLTVKHRVKRGESLSGIASQYHVSAQTLARANGIGRKHPLKRGMELTIPASLGPSRPVMLEESDDPRARSAYVPPRKIGLPAQIQGESSADGRLVHTVRRGETLDGIATQYGVTPEQLRQWNRLKTSAVRRGMRLKVRTDETAEIAAARAVSDSAKIADLQPPRSKKKAAKASVGTSGSVHVVRSGDTLSGIAGRYGVSVAKLKAANGLSTSRIRSGQRLKIPTG